MIHHGDCLDVMRGLDDKSVDLIYADPPFYTQRNFGDFDDKWDSMDAYIDYLRARAQECHRLLKPTGALYLHCDWHASRYIGVMLDTIFGYDNFQNEIIWCYAGAGRSNKRFARKHDTIWYYTKSDEWIFNTDDIRVPYTDSMLQFTQKNKRPNKRKKVDGTYYEWYIHPDGKLPEDWWQIPFLVSGQKERLGYATQKPEALLERIIKASSNVGDVVLDPFCGSGTTLAVANRLHREFIGIDINDEAIRLSKERTRYQQAWLPGV